MKNGNTIRPAREEDLTEIAEIFNWYVQHSFAAYPVNGVEPGFFQAIFRERVHYPLYILEKENDVIGFGMIRPYLPFPSFRRTAQISYFIRDGYTRKCLGTMLLDRLISEARTQGISILLANVSSHNEPSLKFHKKHGFIECGRLKGIGEKFNERFDVVWMRKEV
jgi:L-amino acid N-acyltransferase YncA